jgi:hypothetical protein
MSTTKLTYLSNNATEIVEFVPATETQTHVTSTNHLNHTKPALTSTVAVHAAASKAPAVIDSALGVDDTMSPLTNTAHVTYDHTLRYTLTKHIIGDGASLVDDSIVHATASRGCSHRRIGAAIIEHNLNNIRRA